jgi:hypothetical protein
VVDVGSTVALQLSKESDITMMNPVPVLIHLLDMKVLALGLPAIDDLAGSCPSQFAG